jgi:hypothetical protein
MISHFDSKQCLPVQVSAAVSQQVPPPLLLAVSSDQLASAQELPLHWPSVTRCALLLLLLLLVPHTSALLCLPLL